MLGAALNGRRDAAVIATKFGHTMRWRRDAVGRRARWIRIAVEDSLRRLGTDWIDLYQMHAPDPETPRSRTRCETLTELVSEGKIRCAGSSNLDGWQIADADWTARSRGSDALRQRAERATAFSIDRSKHEVIPACAHFDVGLIPYSPLANGLLTGKHRRGQGPAPGTRLRLAPGANAASLLTDRNFDIVEALERIRSRRGRHAPRRRHRGARRAAAGRVGHRRCDVARAGARRTRGPVAGGRAPADLEELDRVAPRRVTHHALSLDWRADEAARVPGEATVRRRRDQRCRRAAWRGRPTRRLQPRASWVGWP